jgi:hypothetical protein
MNMLDLPDDMDRLIEVEARIYLYRSRRIGVLMRFFFLFLPLAALSVLVLEFQFGLPVALLLLGTSLADHLVHYGRFRGAQREREVLLGLDVE